MIRTVLFDLDGTTLDTNELIFRSFEYVWERIGANVTREQMLPYMGDKLHKMFHAVAEDVSDEEMDELIGMYREYNWAHHDELVCAFPYVREVMAELRAAGIRMGAVTTKIRKTAEMGLRHCGLAPFIETLVSLDDVTNEKPHPEPVLMALERLGTTAEETIMVGDSRADLLAARAAGVRSAAVGWSLKSKEELMSYHPDYWLNDIRELPGIIGIARSDVR